MKKKFKQDMLELLGLDTQSVSIFTQTNKSSKHKSFYLVFDYEISQEQIDLYTTTLSFQKHNISKLNSKIILISLPIN
jgi:hypothetical protein